MRFFCYFLHLLQIVLFSAIYFVNDLYQNHLGFMRNVSFYSQKFEASVFGDKIIILSLLFVLTAIYCFIRRHNRECGLFLALSSSFFIWQSIFSLEKLPIYYLVSGIFCLIVLIQLGIVLLKRSLLDGVFKKNT